MRLPPLGPEELAKNAFCLGLPKPIIDEIAAVATRVRVSASAQLINYHDTDKDVFLILNGRMRVVVTSEGGREITYDIIEAGETIGELSAIDGGKRSARVLAEADAELAKIGQRDFLALMRHADFAMVILRRVSRTARWMTERVREFQAYSVRGRICAELLRLSNSVSGARIAISDRDMASRVGTTRENVTKINAGLMVDKAICREGREIIILEAERLRAIMLECELQ